MDTIIEKYVSAVIFAEGWQYSNGCVYEFFTAQKNRIPTLDEQQSNLTLNKGIRLIDSAIRSIKSQCRKAPTEFLENVKQELVHLKEMNCTK